VKRSAFNPLEAAMVKNPVSVMFSGKPFETETPLPSINLDDFDIENTQEKSSQKSTSTVSGIVEMNGKAAIESMSHLTSKITSLWMSRDLNTMIYEILLDSRDGDRQGLPFEVAKELMFVAQMNLLMRAKEAAPLLGITVGEASNLIAQGDQAALGHTLPKEDVWGINACNTMSTQTAKSADKSEAYKQSILERTKLKQRIDKLSLLLSETPPTPPSVQIDLTAPKSLRCARGSHDEGGQIDQGFFRCIAKELGGLKIPQLVLSNLGDSEKCDWLPSAIHFAKKRCHFSQVIMHVDILTAPESQLIASIAAGLDHLVINLNLASGKWRTKAESITKNDPDYFLREIQNLVRNRDEVQSKTGHRCALSVIQTNRKSSHFLRDSFRPLANVVGLVPFQEVNLPKDIADSDAEARGACHCWAPFIEAHVRTNGHLVACAQDHSGYSFTADLQATTFTEAWLSQEFRKTRQRVLKGEKPGRLCEVCPHRANQS
jgi:hypothetical protein